MGESGLANIKTIRKTKHGSIIGVMPYKDKFYGGLIRIFRGVPYPATHCESCYYDSIDEASNGCESLLNSTELFK